MAMNPMSIIQTMMSEMKVRMPRNFQVVQNLMQNNGNPQDLVNQIMSNISPEQKQNLLSQCKQYRYA
jgi:hypothetical protein